MSGRDDQIHGDTDSWPVDVRTGRRADPRPAPDTTGRAWDLPTKEKLALTAHLLQAPVEAGLAGVTGMAGQVAGGVQGLVSLLRTHGAPDQTARYGEANARQQQTQDAFQYQPRNELSQGLLQTAGAPFEKGLGYVRRAADWTADNVHPEAGAALGTLGEGALWMIGSEEGGPEAKAALALERRGIDVRALPARAARELLDAEMGRGGDRFAGSLHPTDDPRFARFQPGEPGPPDAPRFSGPVAAAPGATPPDPASFTTWRPGEGEPPIAPAERAPAAPEPGPQGPSEGIPDPFVRKLYPELYRPITDAEARRNFRDAYYPGEEEANARGAANAATYGSGAKGERAVKGAVSKIPWGDMPVDEAIGFSRAEGHLKQDKAGQYVGAPRGVTTKAQIDALREKAHAQVAEVGGVGSDWYEKDSGLVNELAPEQPRALAKGIATYSPQSDPGPNLGWTVANWNKLLADPAESTFSKKGAPKTRQQAQTFADVVSHPDAPFPGGQKVESFTRDVAGIDKGTGRTTNDLHAGRSHGYGEDFKRGFTAAEHGFITGETVKLMDDLRRSGVEGPGPGGRWTEASQVQAAEWIASRARGELKKNYGGRSLSELTPAERSDVLTFARKGFSDEVHNYTGAINSEAIPAANSGHRTGLVNAPRELRDAYTDATEGPAGGRDPIVSDLGMLQRNVTEGEGRFTPADSTETEWNPNRTAHPLVSYAKGKAGKRELEPAGERAMSLAAQVRGYLGVQEGVPYHAIKTSGASTGNALRLDFPEALSPERSRSLQADVDQAVAPTRAGSSKMRPALGLVDDGGGRFALTTQDAKGAYGAGGKRDLTKALRQLPPDALRGAKQTPGGYMGGYQYRDWSGPQASGAQTESLVNALRSEPRLEQRLQDGPHTREWADRLLAADQTDLSKAGVGPAREDVQNARTRWVTQGPKGMRQELEAQVRSGRFKSVREAAAAAGLPGYLLAQLLRDDDQ